MAPSCRRPPAPPPSIPPAGPVTIDNDFVHAFHVPGVGSEITFRNVTIVNYESAFLGCVWASINRGGYEVRPSRPRRVPLSACVALRCAAPY